MFMFFFSYSFSLDLIDFPDILHQTLTNGLYFRIDEKKRKTRRRDRTARIIIMFVVVVFFILGMSCGPCLMSFCFIFCFSLERCHGSGSWWWWWWWWCRPVCCALCVCVHSCCCVGGGGGGDGNGIPVGLFPAPLPRVYQQIQTTTSPLIFLLLCSPRCM